MTTAWLVVMTLIASQAPPILTSGDRAAAEAATQAYREAWLSNDPQRIMATLTPDAVLYPSTLPPIAGSDAIRKFWFPSSPSTRVVAMELSIDRVHVDGDTAVTSGMGSLTLSSQPMASPATRARSDRGTSTYCGDSATDRG